MHRVIIIFGFMLVVILSGVILLYDGWIFTGGGSDDERSEQESVVVSKYVRDSGENDSDYGSSGLSELYDDGDGIDSEENSGIGEDNDETSSGNDEYAGQGADLDSDSNAFVNVEEGFSLEGSGSSSYSSGGGSSQDLSSWASSDNTVSTEELDEIDFDEIRSISSGSQADGNSELWGQFKHLLDDEVASNAIVNEGSVVVSEGDIDFALVEQGNVLFVAKSTQRNYELAGRILAEIGVSSNASEVSNTIDEVLTGYEDRITRGSISYSRIGYGVRIEW